MTPADTATERAAPEALHSGHSCNGTVTGAVSGNLVVRSGATCVATGTSIHGSVFVEAGALGFTGDGLSVSGHVDIRDVATGAFSLHGSHIGGWLTATNLGAAATLEVCGNIIPGRVVLAGNKGAVTLGVDSNPLCGGDAIHGAVVIKGNQGSVKLDGETIKEDVRIDGSTASATTSIFNTHIEDSLICGTNAHPPVVATNTIGGTDNCAGTAPGVAACTTGKDLESGDDYVVCASGATTAWVSSNPSGHYHAEQICKTLGYTALGPFGGTCGNICGHCEAPTTCSAPGTETFDGNGNCGSDAFGQILCSSVQWQCTK